MFVLENHYSKSGERNIPVRQPAQISILLMLSARAEDFGMIVHVDVKKVQIWHALEKLVGRPLNSSCELSAADSPGQSVGEKTGWVIPTNSFEVFTNC